MNKKFNWNSFQIQMQKSAIEKQQDFSVIVNFLRITVGVKLLSPSRGFREVCWTRPPVYEISFRENFCWTGQTAGGGK